MSWVAASPLPGSPNDGSPGALGNTLGGFTGGGKKRRQRRPLGRPLNTRHLRRSDRPRKRVYVFCVFIVEKKEKKRRERLSVQEGEDRRQVVSKLLQTEDTRGTGVLFMLGWDEVWNV